MLDRLQISTADPDAPQDSLGRQLSDLRLSVIDRCNFRCGYCMPAESVRGTQPFLAPRDLLSDDELLRIVRAFNALGVRKVRLTGGEPLLRDDLEDIAATFTDDVHILVGTTGWGLGDRNRAPSGGARKQPCSHAFPLVGQSADQER